MVCQFLLWQFFKTFDKTWLIVVHSLANGQLVTLISDYLPTFDPENFFTELKNNGHGKRKIVDELTFC